MKSMMLECWAGEAARRPPLSELERRLDGADPADAVSAAWVKSVRPAHAHDGAAMRSAIERCAPGRASESPILPSAQLSLILSPIQL